MNTEEQLRRAQAEIEALKKSLERYASCRHGERDCFCTIEARAALYPYVARAAREGKGE